MAIGDDKKKPNKSKRHGNNALKRARDFVDTVASPLSSDKKNSHKKTGKKKPNKEAIKRTAKIVSEFAYAMESLSWPVPFVIEETDGKASISRRLFVETLEKRDRTFCRQMAKHLFDLQEDGQPLVSTGSHLFLGIGATMVFVAQRMIQLLHSANNVAPKWDEHGHSVVDTQFDFKNLAGGTARLSNMYVRTTNMDIAALCNYYVDKGISGLGLPYITLNPRTGALVPTESPDEEDETTPILFETIDYSILAPEAIIDGKFKSNCNGHLKKVTEAALQETKKAIVLIAEEDKIGRGDGEATINLPDDKGRKIVLLVDVWKQKFAKQLPEEIRWYADMSMSEPRPIDRSI